jgi:hypothetical protein
MGGDGKQSEWMESRQMLEGMVLLRYYRIKYSHKQVKLTCWLMSRKTHGIMWKGSTLLLVVTQESADKGQDANETMIIEDSQNKIYCSLY